MPGVLNTANRHFITRDIQHGFVDIYVPLCLPWYTLSSSEDIPEQCGWEVLSAFFQDLCLMTIEVFNSNNNNDNVVIVI